MSELLQRERLRAGLTLEEVAACLGVEAPEVAAWERGVREPQATQLRDLAQLYGCSVEALVGVTMQGEAAN